MLISETRQQEEAKCHRKNHYTLNGGISILPPPSRFQQIRMAQQNSWEESISHCGLWQLEWAHSYYVNRFSMETTYNKLRWIECQGIEILLLVQVKLPCQILELPAASAVPQAQYHLDSLNNKQGVICSGSCVPLRWSVGWPISMTKTLMCIGR